MSTATHVLAFATLTLAGCGTYVPTIQEIGDDRQSAILVQEIVSSIHCEIRNALAQIYWDDVKSSRNGQRRAAFLDDWGVQIQLTLTSNENTKMNSSASWMPNAIFSLGGSPTGSAEATRIDKINYFYKVVELRSRSGCIPGSAPGRPFPGSLLVQSNLRLHNALTELMLPIVTNNIIDIHKQDGFTYQVKFKVVGTGTVAPAWALSRVFSVDQSGDFFSATRGRTHDLLITLGPIDLNATGH